MPEIINGIPTEVSDAAAAHIASDNPATALNTTHRTSDGKNHADVVINTSDIGTNETAIGLNTTHKGSNGSDHSKVGANETAIGLNTTHRGSNGSDHSKVEANETAAGLNTTHRSSDGSDHSKVGVNETAIGLNTTHRGLNHDYAHITGNDGATDVTAAELEELTDGSETTKHSHAAVASGISVHTGKVERFAGNNGFGQSFPAFVNYDQATAIAGTRTSDTVFTRGASTWIADALVDQWAFSYVNGTEEDGIWLRITANTTTAITVDGVLYASADRIITSIWQPIQNVYPHGQGGTAFYSGVFDGESIWLAPSGSSNIPKVNVSDGSMIFYAKGGAGGFRGGAYDGTNVWFAPGDTNDILKINTEDGSLTPYSHSEGSNSFVGAVFDGKNIWLVPHNADNLVKIDRDGNQTTYAHGQGSAAFQGGCFDGTYIWLVPHASSNLVRVDPSDGSMSSYAIVETFIGGVFDGESVWLIPSGSPDLVKVDPSDGSMETFAHGQGLAPFQGGFFDGESVWLIPSGSDNLIKVNPADGSMTAYAHGQGGGAPFIGGLFDGERGWLFPYSGDNIISFIPPRFGKQLSRVKNISLPIQTGGGTVTVSVITGAPSIDFNADGEIVYITCPVPKDWNGTSDLIYKAMIQNEIAETDGDDISITWTVHGIADGETGADAGQTCTMDLDLTGGDEAINKVNLAQAVIDHDDDTYPITVGDSIVMKGMVNLGGGTECTGPLHIINHWVEYTGKK